MSVIPCFLVVVGWFLIEVHFLGRNDVVEVVFEATIRRLWVPPCFDERKRLPDMLDFVVGFAHRVDLLLSLACVLVDLQEELPDLMVALFPLLLLLLLCHG